MANFKKVAKKLGLRDMEESTIGDEFCQDCGSKLRFGKDEQNCTLSYCPKCKKRIATVFTPRFPTIEISPHDD